MEFGVAMCGSCEGDHSPRWTSTRMILLVFLATLVTLSRVAQLMSIPYELQLSPELGILFKETGLDRLLDNPPPTPSQIAQRLLLS